LRSCGVVYRRAREVLRSSTSSLGARLGILCI
jgi:hypothetical protein